MNTEYKKLFEQIDEDLPTHYVSIHPYWLTRDEWDMVGFPSATEEEKRLRIERRTNFICQLAERSKSFLFYNPSNKEIWPVCREDVMNVYLKGNCGSYYVDPALSIVFRPHYASDDVDLLWSLNDSLPQMIHEVVTDSFLHIINF